MSLSSRFWFLGLFCFLAACTSSPNLESYPQRQIDRPFTLPDDVATWTSVVGTSVVDDGRSSSSLNLNPLIFEQALNENLTLEYSPIPLGLRYQISNTEQNILGASLRTGIGYSSFSGLILQPILGFYHRHRPGGSWAWESSVAYSKELSDRPVESESAFLSTGPMFQLSDTVVLSPDIGFGVTRNELAEFQEYEGVQVDVDEFLFSVPASMSFRWLFDRQWEYGVFYRLNSLILEEDRLAVHSLNMSVTHFW
ncbi:MAG: hypothetical protein AAF203_00145 [Pseudomonadota bacterium]